MTKKNNDKIIFERLAAFFTMIGFLIAILLKRDDKYVMFYAKQGLVLFLASIAASIISWIPVIGWLFGIFVFILWAMTWINALSGEQKNTWLIGDLAEKIKL